MEGNYFSFRPPLLALPTIYLEGNPEYNHISSTLIQNISKDDMGNHTVFSSSSKGRGENELEKLVPAEVAKEVAQLLYYSSDPKES